MIPRTVLIVDDSPVQRAQAAALCHQLGVMQTHEAAHGHDALQLLDSLTQPPEAMIVDLEMPVMDGVQFIDTLAQRGLRIPFILASTREAALRSSVETMARLQNLPVMPGLQKPLKASALREALMRLPQAQDAVRAPMLRTGSALTAGQLAHAIASGAIQPHFQPKVCARTGLMRGVEVLARWVDPALGHPRPDEFIPLAEAEGLIHALTMSMVRQALAQGAHWQARGLMLSQAINLSPTLLSQQSLVDELAALAAEARVPPAQIVFEITEGSIVAAPGVALGVLARLRMKGFGLSIDDYGTGFSSMQRLARVPWTELKIDRSFVDGAHRSEAQRAILQSAIEMASRLHLVSVAEGIEHREDWQLLQRFGCTLGQGWLFGRSMPGAELPGWLKEHAQRLPALRSGAADEINENPNEREMGA